MKNLTILTIGLLVLTATSCKERRTKGSHSAVGDIAEVAVFSDHKTLEEYDALIDTVWGPRFLTLADEPYFEIRKSDISRFTSVIKRNYNLFILVHEDNWDLIKEQLNEKAQKAVEQAFKRNYEDFRLKNLFGRPQVVYFVVAPNQELLGQKLKAKASELFYNAIEIERETTINTLIRTKVEYDSFFMEMKNKYGYGFRRPSIYTQRIVGDDFNGISRYIADKHVGVYAYDEPYLSKKQFDKEYILQLRDSMLKMHIEGPDRKDGIRTYMATNRSGDVPVTTKVTRLNGYYAVETRGWWKMENDFMGGPFVSYTVYMDDIGKIVTLETNVFAPNRSKRRMLREGELIISTLASK